MKGILVVSHGSRSEEARETFEQIIQWTKEELDQSGHQEADRVHMAYMELCKPTLPEAIDDMVRQGFEEITVVPYFLYRGIHLKEDIPEILEACRKKHPDLTIELGEMLGQDRRLAKILADRICQ